ncbi:LPS export ABC transporter ATP-binding protein [Euhalothece natronophila Z-M001]|uniref:LPS export ABC transporter ATP-binding protein n=1 Tax=Euhalothece natronophila Z-M001 TaxID=522448 RepID=A0A5B8NII7_9CHRO|nr:LPS export ABC transporter ATP-binding protein [Euhalothece natronophila]QDZ38992.1 LPS export ABC transporter ATP-binding protein [Euhalothece natronophila Z-M001]
MNLVLKQIYKSYGKAAIVRGVNLMVTPGEIVGLLGPNGAGKTTTFYIATGLVKPDQGQVWLGEKEITNLPIDQRSRLGIGYLPQQPSIFRHLTVADNLRLVIQQNGYSSARGKQRLRTLLEEFHLEKVATTEGNRISGGERRRTELARALAIGDQGPQFLLLDEPFAGVDPIAVSELQVLINHLRSQNMGILITDHNVRETLEITDRAYIMSEGDILASGKAEELYQDPLVRQYYLGDKFEV